MSGIAKDIKLGILGLHSWSDASPLHDGSRKSPATVKGKMSDTSTLQLPPLAPGRSRDPSIVNDASMGRTSPAKRAYGLFGLRSIGLLIRAVSIAIAASNRAANVSDLQSSRTGYLFIVSSWCFISCCACVWYVKLQASCTFRASISGRSLPRSLWELRSKRARKLGNKWRGSLRFASKKHVPPRSCGKYYGIRHECMALRARIAWLLSRERSGQSHLLRLGLLRSHLNKRLALIGTLARVFG